MSQAALAERIGVTFQQVQKYERGANRIGASRLHELSRVLDVPVGFFFEDMPDTAMAGARPGDKPIELSKPVEGATVKDATNGIAVDFTCPQYHRMEQDEIVESPSDGYRVVLATKPDVDQWGMLLVANRVDLRDARVLEPPATPSTGPVVTGDAVPLRCTAAEDDAGHGLLPREPGTYWWQAYRTCVPYLCRGGVEVSDVWAVTVTRTVCSVQRAALTKARADLAAARKQLKRKPTAARRARVERLGDRVSLLRARLRVVFACR
jgi:transcriptional regulator with XRE-family HTH domain